MELVKLMIEALLRKLFPRQSEVLDEFHEHQWETTASRLERRHPLVALLLYAPYFVVWFLVFALGLKFVGDHAAKWEAGNAGTMTMLALLTVTVLSAIAAVLMLVSPVQFLASMFFWITGQEQSRGRSTRMTAWRSLHIMKLAFLFGAIRAAMQVSEVRPDDWTLSTWAVGSTVILALVIAIGYVLWIGVLVAISVRAVLRYRHGDYSTGLTRDYGGGADRSEYVEESDGTDPDDFPSDDPQAGSRAGR